MLEWPQLKDTAAGLPSQRPNHQRARYSLWYQAVGPFLRARSGIPYYITDCFNCQAPVLQCENGSMFVKDNTTGHIALIIARYSVPASVASEARVLGGEAGLSLVRSWVKQHKKGPAQTKPPSPLVKIPPELGAVALRTRQDRLLRLWLLCRHLDVQGQGRVRAADLLALIADLGLSLRQARRLIRGGDDMWWKEADGCLYLRGLESMSLALDCERGPGRSVFVPLDKFRGLETFRAYLYGAWIASRPDGLIIGRQKLMMLFARTRQTLTRWERLVDIEITHVLAYAPARTLDTPAHIIGRYPDADHTWGEQIKGRWCEVWQQPNHYDCHLPLAAKGMLRKIRRNCKHALGLVEGQCFQRLYFDHPKGAARALESGSVAFLRQGTHHAAKLYAFCAA